jgi:hypothetical protein
MNEHARLLRKWATGKATRAEILRCIELDCRVSGDDPKLRTLFEDWCATEGIDREQDDFCFEHLWSAFRAGALAKVDA